MNIDKQLQRLIVIEQELNKSIVSIEKCCQELQSIKENTQSLITLCYVLINDKQALLSDLIDEIEGKYNLTDIEIDKVIRARLSNEPVRV